MAFHVFEKRRERVILRADGKGSVGLLQLNRDDFDNCVFHVEKFIFTSRDYL